jgi:hypothetical protein
MTGCVDDDHWMARENVADIEILGGAVEGFCVGAGRTVERTVLTKYLVVS